MTFKIISRGSTNISHLIRPEVHIIYSLITYLQKQKTRPAGYLRIYVAKIQTCWIFFYLHSENLLDIYVFNPIKGTRRNYFVFCVMGA